MNWKGCLKKCRFYLRRFWLEKIKCIGDIDLLAIVGDSGMEAFVLDEKYGITCNIALQ